MNLRKTIVLLLALCVPLGVFAGGGSEATGGEPIKVGALFAVTGPAAWLGLPEARTAESLVKQINDQGGVDGRPIELILKDTQANSEKAISFTKQLIEEDQVLAIIGPSTSGESLAIKAICEENKTILLSAAANEGIVVPVAQYVFKTPQKDSYAAIMIFRTMQQMGIKRIGVVVGNSGFGNGGKAQLEKYAPDYGIEIVIAEVYDRAATDLTGVLTKVKAQNVQAVVNWSIVPAQSIIPKNMKQLGMDVPLFQSHGFGNIEYVKAAGEAAEGIIFPCGRLLIAETLPFDHPQKELLMSYKTSYEAEYGDEASTFGGHAYDALVILVEAIKKAGTTNTDAVRSAIENLDIMGTGGHFQFSASDHNGLGIDSFEMLTVKNGKFVALNP